MIVGLFHYGYHHIGILQLAVSRVDECWLGLRWHVKNFYKPQTSDGTCVKYGAHEDRLGVEGQIHPPNLPCSLES